METGKRELVRQRAGGRCEYCLLPEEVDEWPFHVEHIVAKQHGGGDDMDNLCWACSRCNLYKGTNLVSLDPASGARAPIFDPRQQPGTITFVCKAPSSMVRRRPAGRQCGCSA